MIRSTDMAALQTLLTQMPLNEQQQLQAEELIKRCSLDELQRLGLAAPVRPAVPRGLEKLQPTQRLQATQRVISSLHYNHAPGYMYNVSKDRPFSSIMSTAREVLRDALPIKCVEAVFLGLLLTSSWADLERLPVGFKSKCQGQVCRHIILAVQHTPTGLWGALGISRRPNLQFKDLGAATLADLMADYKASYEGWGHTLYKIRVGLPVEHDPAYTGQVCWRYCNVSCGRHSWDKCRMVLNAFADNTRMLANRFKVLGFRPPSRGAGDVPDKTGRLPVTRVALSGHASVSPKKRRPAAITPPEDKYRRPGKPQALQPSPARGRPGCTSAPPRQRPGNNSTASTPARPNRPADLPPAGGHLKQFGSSNGHMSGRDAPRGSQLSIPRLTGDAVSILPANSMSTTPRPRQEGNSDEEGKCEQFVVVCTTPATVCSESPVSAAVSVSMPDPAAPVPHAVHVLPTLKSETTGDSQAVALEELLFEDSSDSDVDEGEGDDVVC